MRENTIAVRIYDFLKDYPPFNLVEKKQLLDVASKVTVQYVPSGTIVFRQNEPTKDHFYIIREGVIDITRLEDNETKLIDIRDEGDIMGLRPLFAFQPYLTTATAKEDTLLYLIKTNDVRHLMENNHKMSMYLVTSFATGINNQYAPEKKTYRTENPDNQDDSNSLLETQLIQIRRKPKVCSPNIAIKTAAEIMTQFDVNALIVINENGNPIGILRDTDLRRKVVTGLFSREDLVETIMSQRVVTVPPDCSIAVAQMAMLRGKTSRVVVTRDGTQHSEVVGIYSESDILLAQAETPGAIVVEMWRSNTAEELILARQKADGLIQKYLTNEVGIRYVSSMITEINDVLTQRAIQIAAQELHDEGFMTPDVKFAWMALGSCGREEQVIRTDLDNAIVFEDVPAEIYQSTSAYFQKLGRTTNRILHETGFKYCKGDMMAGNPEWTCSYSEWREKFTNWITNPDGQSLLNACIFFDFRPIDGDFTLCERLAEHIFNELNNASYFLTALAKIALMSPPPMSFFRSFIVEKNGEHKDEFDIKIRGMRPLIDAARLLTLEAKFSNINNTFRRFEKLAVIDPKNADLYESAADAFELLMRFKAIQGLKHKDSGRYFNPSELNKLERLMLKDTFAPINELQSLLKIRFRL
jgi:CBS domain-containing protein